MNFCRQKKSCRGRDKSLRVNTARKTDLDCGVRATSTYEQKRKRKKVNRNRKETKQIGENTD
jgi:hypothetical protein